jgi:hypothetical protein
MISLVVFSYPKPQNRKQDMKIAVLGTGMVGKQQLLEADGQVWQFIAVTHIP